MVPCGAAFTLPYKLSWLGIHYLWTTMMCSMITLSGGETAESSSWNTHAQGGGYKCYKCCVLNYHTTVYIWNSGDKEMFISTNSFLQCAILVCVYFVYHCLPYSNYCINIYNFYTASVIIINIHTIIIYFLLYTVLVYMYWVGIHLQEYSL